MRTAGYPQMAGGPQTSINVEGGWKGMRLAIWGEICHVKGEDSGERSHYGEAEGGYGTLQASC